jgi:hypothetical protein
MPPFLIKKEITMSNLIDRALEYIYFAFVVGVCAGIIYFIMTEVI